MQITFKQTSLSIPIIIAEAEELDKLILYPFGDLHYDSIFCDKELFLKLIKDIKQNDNIYAIFLGDIFDVLQYLSKEAVLQDLNKSMMELLDILSEIKDKILLMVSGNHDHRFLKQLGIDPVKFLSYSLQIPYTSHQAILHLLVGTSPKSIKRRNSYVGVVSHGWGGGRTLGAKINKIKTISDIWEGVDFFILGHYHQSIYSNIGKFRYYPEKKAISLITPHLIIASAFQKLSNYSLRLGLQPSTFVLNKVVFSGKEKYVKIVSEIL